YRILLNGIVANPNQRASELPLLSDEERRQVLVQWNQTTTDFPRHASIHQIFETQVERSSEAVAVEFQRSRWTYRELNARANRVAECLRSRGVGPESRVGLCIERSL